MPVDLTCFSWIQLVKKSDLPSNAKYICYYLSTFMNLEHDVAWPSQARIAHETGLARSTVQKWLDYLDEKEWLVKKSRSHAVTTKSGTQFQNEYLINIPIEVARQSVKALQGGPMNDKRWPDERQEVARQSVNNNNVNNNRITKGRFTPPTLQEVKKYIAEKAYPVDAVSFINHYESVNWFRGKTKIKDWKACVRTWVKNSNNKPSRVMGYGEEI